MNLPLFIAKRYLFAKKSHNVINIISGISAIGIAIGTAALIIILSIYNGFDELIKSMLSSVEPELTISPSRGKVFIPEGEAYDWLYEQSSVKNICTILEENIFINYDGRQNTAKAKGVDKIYEEESPLRQHIVEGEFSLHRGDVPLAAIGQGLAYNMRIRPHFVAPIKIYYPSRKKSISISNPAASLRSIQVFPKSIFMVNSDIDSELIILPIEEMRNLLEYEDEVSKVEIRFWGNSEEEVIDYNSKEIRRVQKELQTRLGDDFQVKNRFQQNESLYKMMKYEKASIYLLLLFIIIIIAFNIFGSLSMLIIDKRDDAQTLRSLGAKKSLIKRIFILEGWLISLYGMIIGLIIGIIFCIAQHELGFIKMPGNFLLQAYPIILNTSDVLLTAIGVAVIGYIIALLPTKSISIQ